MKGRSSISSVEQKIPGFHSIARPDHEFATPAAMHSIQHFQHCNAQSLHPKPIVKIQFSIMTAVDFLAPLELQSMNSKSFCENLIVNLRNESLMRHLSTDSCQVLRVFQVFSQKGCKIVNWKLVKPIIVNSVTRLMPLKC